MKLRHSPYHWILAALVAVAFLLTLSEAHGQNGAAAMFEGRPAAAGAQGRLGAQTGVAQGGVGAQGDEEAAVHGGTSSTAKTDTRTDKKTVRKSKTAEVKPKRDPGMAKDQHSATGKAKRAVRNTVSRARHGVSPVDSGVKEDAGLGF
jgi:hypothetical protein